jgi:hypothetical protein
MWAAVGCTNNGHGPPNNMEDDVPDQESDHLQELQSRMRTRGHGGIQCRMRAARESQPISSQFSRAHEENPWGRIERHQQVQPQGNGGIEPVHPTGNFDAWAPGTLQLQAGGKPGSLPSQSPCIDIEWQGGAGGKVATGDSNDSDSFHQPWPNHCRGGQITTHGMGFWIDTDRGLTTADQGICMEEGEEGSSRTDIYPDDCSVDSNHTESSTSTTSTERAYWEKSHAILHESLWGRLDRLIREEEGTQVVGKWEGGGTSDKEPTLSDREGKRRWEVEAQTVLAPDEVNVDEHEPRRNCHNIWTTEPPTKPSNGSLPSSITLQQSVSAWLSTETCPDNPWGPWGGTQTGSEQVDGQDDPTFLMEDKKHEREEIGTEGEEQGNRGAPVTHSESNQKIAQLRPDRGQPGVGNKTQKQLYVGDISVKSAANKGGAIAEVGNRDRKLCARVAGRSLGPIHRAGHTLRKQRQTIIRARLNKLNILILEEAQHKRAGRTSAEGKAQLRWAMQPKDGGTSNRMLMPRRRWADRTLAKGKANFRWALWPTDGSTYSRRSRSKKALIELLCHLRKKGVEIWSEPWSIESHCLKGSKQSRIPHRGRQPATKTEAPLIHMGIYVEFLSMARYVR